MGACSTADGSPVGHRASSASAAASARASGSAAGRFSRVDRAVSAWMRTARGPSCGAQLTRAYRCRTRSAARPAAASGAAPAGGAGGWDPVRGRGGLPGEVAGDGRGPPQLGGMSRRVEVCGELQRGKRQARRCRPLSRVQGQEQGRGRGAAPVPLGVGVGRQQLVQAGAAVEEPGEVFGAGDVFVDQVRGRVADREREPSQFSAELLGRPVGQVGPAGAAEPFREVAEGFRPGVLADFDDAAGAARQQGFASACRGQRPARTRRGGRPPRSHARRVGDVVQYDEPAAGGGGQPVQEGSGVVLGALARPAGGLHPVGCFGVLGDHVVDRGRVGPYDQFGFRVEQRGVGVGGGELGLAAAGATDEDLRAHAVGVRAPGLVHEPADAVTRLERGCQGRHGAHADRPFDRWPWGGGQVDLLPAVCSRLDEGRTVEGVAGDERAVGVRGPAHGVGPKRVRTSDPTTCITAPPPFAVPYLQGATAWRSENHSGGPGSRLRLRGRRAVRGRLSVAGARIEASNRKKGERPCPETRTTSITLLLCWMPVRR